MNEPLLANFFAVTVVKYLFDNPVIFKSVEEIFVIKNRGRWRIKHLRVDYPP